MRNVLGQLNALPYNFGKEVPPSIPRLCIQAQAARLAFDLHLDAVI
jgi:hypothetical protein